MSKGVYGYIGLLILLLAMVLVPYHMQERPSQPVVQGLDMLTPPRLPPAPGPSLKITQTPPPTPLPPPAVNPKAEIKGINYRDPVSGNYIPLLDNSELSAEVYHFNAKLKNTGDENIVVYHELVQADGNRLLPLGAPDWFLRPGEEVHLFMQGANLKPAGRNIQLTLRLMESRTNRLLDQKELTITSR